ncbi:hypothetical protein CDEN61S_01255 [Castellaniella denitrificans]
MHDRGYLVIGGVDGKTRYIALNARDELANYPVGAAARRDGARRRGIVGNRASARADHLSDTITNRHVEVST